MAAQLLDCSTHHMQKMIKLHHHHSPLTSQYADDLHNLLMILAAEYWKFTDNSFSIVLCNQQLLEARSKTILPGMLWEVGGIISTFLMVRFGCYLSSIHQLVDCISLSDLVLS